jgi:hypothetical protein
MDSNTPNEHNKDSQAQNADSEAMPQEAVLNEAAPNEAAPNEAARGEVPNNEEPETRTEQENEAELAALLKAYAEAVSNENAEEAEVAALQVWQSMAEQEETTKSPWLQAMEEATACELAFDWTGAEEAYKRAVEASNDQAMLKSKALGSLSALYSMLDLDVLAWEAAQAATRIARMEAISSLVSLALLAEAKLYLKAKDLKIVLNVINEAFYAIEDGPLHNLERAYALVLRAEYWTKEGTLKKAEQDLSIAWKMLEPMDMPHAAGWQTGLASYWAATARFRAELGDAKGAIEAWHEAVKRRRLISLLPQLEGPYKHNALALVLWEQGKAMHDTSPDSAAALIAESNSIRRSIGLTPLAD